jgi:hypothetical protein
VITTYLIVPAWSDQAGQCRIVARDHEEFHTSGDRMRVGLDNYRAQPHLWSEVGVMNSRGELVCLDAPVGVYGQFKACEPLMAGTTYTFEAEPAPINPLIVDLFQRMGLPQRHARAAS